jgi:hypothetical protein
MQQASQWIEEYRRFWEASFDRKGVNPEKWSTHSMVHFSSSGFIFLGSDILIWAGIKLNPLGDK